MIDYCMLYVVATPIGNLMDISYRAVDILQHVDLIVAEDTRHSQILLKHYNINTKMISLHEHNEKQIIDKILVLLQQGQKIAVISDAGTPLISDPGYHLVKSAHLAKIPVTPIPGASAAVAAISVSGLATDQFIFIGFLPVKLPQKQKALLDLSLEQRTMIFFESPHRVLETVDCMQKAFHLDRAATFCRELTKKFETIVPDNLKNIYNFINNDKVHQTKGEIVLVVAGATQQKIEAVGSIDPKIHEMLKILLNELPITKATSVAAKITGVSKKILYNYCLSNLSSGY